MKDQEEVKAKQKELTPNEPNDYETRIDLIKNKRTQPDIFNTDIPNYIQSLIEVVLDDDNFHDVEFLNDVPYVFAPSNEILPGKRTIFKNEILKQTIGYLEPKTLHKDYTEEILFEKAKEFIKAKFGELLKYTFADERNGDKTNPINDYKGQANDFAKLYVHVCKSLNTNKPTPEQLAQITGLSQQKIRRLLGDLNVIVMVKKEIDKKLNYKMKTETKNFWIEALTEINALSSKIDIKKWNNKHVGLNREIEQQEEPSSESDYFTSSKKKKRHIDY